MIVSRRGLLAAAALAGAVLLYAGYKLVASHRPLRWYGTVEVRTITVGSRAGGRVKALLAREGERVRAGQPLIVLEAKDVTAQARASRARLDQAQADLDRLENGARPEEAAEARARVAAARAALVESHKGPRIEEIQAAESRLAAAAARAANAASTAERQRKLARAGATAQADVDAADAALQSAVGDRDALRQQLAQLRRGTRPEELVQATARFLETLAGALVVLNGARPEELRRARAAVALQRFTLDAQQAQVDELTIRAPRPARVESLDLRPGDLLAPNAPAATLVEADQLYVRLYIPETQLGRAYAGMEVAVSVNSFPHRSFRGVITRIDSIGQFTPRNLTTADERAHQLFAARVEILEGQGLLRAGMAATIRRAP